MLVSRFEQLISLYKNLHVSRSARYYIGRYDELLYVSGREAQIILHVLFGLTAKESAKELGLSFRTVEYYLKILKRKMRCKNRRELMAKVIESHFLASLVSEQRESS